MRVLFTIYPATAHLYPVVPLARALHAAGHEVRVAAHPDLAAAIATAGLTAVPLGEPVVHPATAGATGRPTDVLALDPLRDDRWEAVRPYLLGLFSRCYPVEPTGPGRPAFVDDLVAFARSWRPDLVIWDPLCPPGAIAARACGAAHGRLLWGLDNTAWIIHRQGPSDDRFTAWLEPHLRRHQLAPGPDLLTGQWSIDLVPPAMRLPLDLPYLPMRRVPYADTTDLPEWLHRTPERPRVCLTLGLTTRTFYAGDTGVSTPDLLRAFSGLDVEVVATLTKEQLAAVPELPGTVRTVDFLPLDVLLPTCSAIVHHGGGGTFAAAVAHRVPQIVVPVPKWDETATARHVLRRGAGIVLDGARLSAGELRAQLARVLSEPSFRAGARSLYEDALALPGPTDTVPLLERLAAGRPAHPDGVTACAS